MALENKETPQRDRLSILKSHLHPPSLTAATGVERNLTAAEPFYHSQKYSVILPEKLSCKTWNVRRSILSPEVLVDSFDAPDENVRTLYDIAECSAARFADEPFLGQRPGGQEVPYEFSPYADYAARRTAVGSGLVAMLGEHAIAADPLDAPKVGLYSVNCPEWVISEGACHAYSLVPVPLYDTLGPDAVRYICGHAELKAVFCSHAVFHTLCESLAEGCACVKLVVVYGKPQPGSRALPSSAPGRPDCRVETLASVERAGAAALRPHAPPVPSAMATICYTSGTTGVPKGAVLTHSNLIANIAGSSSFFDLGPGDVHISYLPLAHIYERVLLTTCLRRGVAVGFFRGDVTLLLDDIACLRPTLFASVPRLWNRIYDKLTAKIAASNPIARKLFEMALASKAAALDAGDPKGGRMAPLWDKLVFSKVKEALGGRVRFATTGASPISKDVLSFLRCCFGVIAEGYGMTETSCLITLTDFEDSSNGHVGAPCPCVEVKLEDIPEMNYLNSDQPHPRGEVCVRGPSVFQGYYKDEKNTKETIDDEGWLHTGDVGLWLPGGQLKIIDRKKNIFKLAQGEYVAPEKIENVYTRAPLLAQCFVHGDSLRPELVAIVVPDEETLLPWAKAHGLGGGARELCRDQRVEQAVLAQMHKEGRDAKLQGFEQVKAITLHPELFSVEQGTLTPTFKLKRPQAKALHQGAIDTMYAKLSAA